MKSILIKNALLINEGEQYHADVYIKGSFIERIERQGINMAADEVIDATGKILIPGLIDDQVHFREPGLTHKGDLYTEPKSAVAGGVTSFMEMPNTSPSAVTLELLEQKYERAATQSLANYSFFMGTTNTNLDELLRVDETKICGVKIFMGSSTGDMLVDDPNALERIFSEVKTIIATHCEKDPIVKANQAEVIAKHGEAIDVTWHSKIRSEEACYLSSSYAVDLAKKHNTRLHILHISTAKELSLFDKNKPLVEKRITAEACTHHLWFSDADYASKGNFIKWNPAIKKASDRDAILQGVIDGHIDILATDHAPHTLEEKSQTYLKTPSGGPLVQHTLNALIQLHKKGKISLEKIIEKACHNPAILFEIDRRGYIREGFYADLVLVDLNQKYTVSKSNILYKCGWSPFEGEQFDSVVTHTLVNGNVVYREGKFDESTRGMRLKFNR